MKILLTGATGFVGGHLLRSIQDKNEIICLARESTKSDIESRHLVRSDFEMKSIQTLDLNLFDLIIHCAARTHVMRGEVNNPLEEYRKTNTNLTLALAQRAAEQGVKRFIFISSIKVNGESTSDIAFTVNDIPSPQDDYALSKYEAEQQLLELAEKSGMEVVIIRPPLIYGPGVKANFASLMHLVSKGFPLPFGSITTNKRSLVSVTNLVDLIITCIEHPKAANQVFLVSDDNNISTSKMVQLMATSLQKPSFQIPVPKWCYRAIAGLTGKQDVVERLLGSLQLDITHTKDTLGWVPPQKIEDAFQETADAFIKSREQ